jgi:hypothetical protein
MLDAGIPIFGVDVGPGRIRLEGQMAQDYSERLLDYITHQVIFQGLYIRVRLPIFLGLIAEFWYQFSWA